MLRNTVNPKRLIRAITDETACVPASHADATQRAAGSGGAAARRSGRTPAAGVALPRGRVGVRRRGVSLVALWRTGVRVPLPGRER